MTPPIAPRSWRWWPIVAALFSTALSAPAAADDGARVHGLWVWKGDFILGVADGAERLRDFCRAQAIDEVYLAVSSHGRTLVAPMMPELIDVLHRSGVRVEALLSSEDADNPGPPRRKLLNRVRAVVEFDQAHPRSRFDGIHLDLEPQQRAENKGAGNLRFLPGLVSAYREVRVLAEANGLSVNADIQRKLLQGSVAARRELLTSLPRLTLMLYEVGHGDDADSTDVRTEKLRVASRKFLESAYAGLDGTALATIVIGLRTPDYGAALPGMLKALDEANGTNAHYQGWARHSYNDVLAITP
jgi:hypothetical protein